MTRTYRLGVIRGDGTGPEVVGQALKVLDAVRDGFEVLPREFDLGAERFLRTGDVLPDAELDELGACDAILLGAVGDPSVPPGVLERGLLLTITTRRPTRSTRLCPWSCGKMPRRWR